MSGAFIERQRQKAQAPDLRTQNVQAALAAVQRLGPDGLPPVPMMNAIGSYGPEHFLGAMSALFPELVQRGNLTPAAHVLDIGCGCGRLALPFSYFLAEGRYYGIDVWPEGIAWCQEHITARAPGCDFRVLEAANNYYFQDFDGTKRNRFALAHIPERSIDFVFAISVFTHLIAEDAAQYLGEIARVLRPDGVAYLTAFMIDAPFFAFVARTGDHRGVKPVASGVYQAYAGSDFFCGYAPERWAAMASAAGLRIVGVEPGTWAEKPGARVYQDTFILQTASAEPGAVDWRPVSAAEHAAEQARRDDLWTRAQRAVLAAAGAAAGGRGLLARLTGPPPLAPLNVIARALEQSAAETGPPHGPLLPPADFDEMRYLRDNPDIAAAVAAGTFASGFEHFIRYGRGEGRPRPHREA